jgi:hypothetical protein
MKKLFLLIPALVLSLALSAEVIQINTGTADALRKALNNAQSGDIIEMAAGTYVESNSNWIAFTNKNVTVRAAEGAEVILQPKVSIRLKEGATAEFIGIKFDCGHLSDLASYSDVIFPADATDGKNIILRNCEFYGWTQNNAIIYSASSNTLNSLIIENCYFHDVTKSCVFLENQTNAVNVQITNSTFANIATVTGSYYAGVIDMRSTTGSLLVDHCTFYNVQAMNTDYAAIGKVKLTSGAVVSNCIFAMPTNTSGVRTIRDAVTANNCLVYNYSNDSGYGMQSNVTKNNCTIADPLFADAANGDFSLAGDWTTMTLSPARGAATDGSDLGDPRWYSAEVLPSSNFVAPYAFVGAKAQIAGNLWYDSENNYMYYNDKSECGTAKWKIHATRACAVKATLNMTDGSSSGHIFRIEILDANGNQVAEVAETYSEHDGDIDLPNPLAIPAEGDYTVILHNDQSWSSAKINSITFAYIGGAVVTVPAEEVLGAEAVLVDNGHMKVSKLANGDLQYGDNSEPLGEYVYWNINATKDGKMDVALNVPAPGEGDPSGHRFLVELYTDLNASPIASAEETADSYATGEIALPAITLPAAGNYIVKLTNQKQWSSAILHSIVFTYKGGARATLPANFDFADALLSAKAHVTEGNLWFNTIGDSNPVGQWAKWNVKVAEAGTFLFTMNVSSTNGQSYKISILDMEENELDSYASGSVGSGDKEIKHYFNLAAGNYIVQLENTYSWSQGHVVSLAVTVATDVFVLDENTEDDGSIAAAAATNEEYTFLLKRSFTAGKYYTICLPVSSWNDELKLAFGNDYELWQMSSATQAGDEIDLNFEQANSEGFSAGKPYIIKPSVDVKNPIFYNKKKIKNYTYNNVQEFTAADFVGTFYKDVIPAGESNLYLQNNNLYYSETNNTQIKGTRAWIRLKSQSGAAPKARIVLRDNTATAIDLVNSENKAIKRIENGQVVIIRDGQKYNVMGIKLQ